MPRQWYNLAPDLPTPMNPPLGPDGKPVTPEQLAAVFPMNLIEQEMSQQRWIDIPEYILEMLVQWRPSPLVRAYELEQALGTPAKIYYKNEGVSPTGSHKPNTAVAQKQLAKVGIKNPDVVIGCCGGGSNFAGISFPFMYEKIHGADIEIIGAEPTWCPTLTNGPFVYDHGDIACMTPLLPIYSLGHNFIPAPIHAGGLRYHGMAPFVSAAYGDNLMSAVAIPHWSVTRPVCCFRAPRALSPPPKPPMPLPPPSAKPKRPRKRAKNRSSCLTSAAMA
jgi:predicted alternative tryptophan synthase beta-subunit